MENHDLRDEISEQPLLIAFEPSRLLAILLDRWNCGAVRLKCTMRSSDVSALGEKVRGNESTDHTDA